MNKELLQHTVNVLKQLIEDKEGHKALIDTEIQDLWREIRRIEKEIEENG